MGTLANGSSAQVFEPSSANELCDALQVGWRCSCDDAAGVGLRERGDAMACCRSPARGERPGEGRAMLPRLGRGGVRDVDQALGAPQL
eukprot:7125057-Prymnesium_polylepis.2